MAKAAAAKAPQKKRGPKPAAQPKQQAFEGNGFPDPPPAEVVEARDEYLSAMRSHAKTAEKKAAKHEALIAAMHKHDISRIRLDGENKFFEIEQQEKVKTKTVPKDARERRESGDEGDEFSE